MSFAALHIELLQEIEDKLNCHADYWGGQTQEIASENPFPRPAVFIEYPTLDFTGTKGVCGYSLYLPLRLHLVTDLYHVTTGTSGVTALFKLTDTLIQLLNEQEGVFKKAKLVSVAFDQNPGNMVEHIITIQIFINL